MVSGFLSTRTQLYSDMTNTPLQRHGVMKYGWDKQILFYHAKLWKNHIFTGHHKTKDMIIESRRSKKTLKPFTIFSISGNIRIKIQHQDVKAALIHSMPLPAVPPIQQITPA